MAFTGSGEQSAPPDEPTAGDGIDEPDWTDQVTDLVVDTVGKVRAKTTGPVLNVAHSAAYAIVAAIIVLPILIAFFAGLVKGLNWLIPGDVWIVYTIIAAMLWLGGWALWLQRDRPGGDDS